MIKFRDKEVVNLFFVATNLIFKLGSLRKNLGRREREGLI
jgi:hypothetical protein